MCNATLVCKDPSHKLVETNGKLPIDSKHEINYHRPFFFCLYNYLIYSSICCIHGPEAIILVEGVLKDSIKMKCNLDTIATCPYHGRVSRLKTKGANAGLDIKFRFNLKKCLFYFLWELFNYFYPPLRPQLRSQSLKLPNGAVCTVGTDSATPHDFTQRLHARDIDVWRLLAILTICLWWW